jgi:two-component system sensor histidine kinase/response regulator
MPEAGCLTAAGADFRRAEVTLQLVEALPDGVFLIDLEDPEVPNRVVFANVAACRACRRSRGEILGRPACDLFEPSRLDDELVQRLHELGPGQAFSFESRLRRGDGTVLPVEARARVLEHDGHRMLLAVGRDITGRKRQGASRRRIEEQFRNAFDQAAIGMALVSPAGRFLRVNASLCGIVGYSEAELLGLDLRAITHPADLEADLRDVRRLLEGEAAQYTTEKRFVHKQGRAVWVLLSVSLVHDDRGAPLHFIVQIQDIDQRRRAEEECRAAREAAEQANRAKSAFLAQMSHEVRTPLTAILGFAELLMEDPGVRAIDPDRFEDLRTIHENGRLLLALIDDLLDLSRVESARVAIQLTSCDPSSILQEVVATFRARAAARGLELSAAACSRVPRRISTDAVRLRQILNNLVGNAIKFTPAGSVAVRLTAEAGPASDPVIVFEVADTGIGMTPEVASRAFEPFFRAEDPTVQKTVGTGLGLAISARLAEELGGSITVQSTSGQGSIITLRLPTRPAHDEDAREQPSAWPGGLGSGLGLRLLLAEDNEANRRVCTFRLEQAGARVETARDGEEAIAMARRALGERRPYDVILLDMQMPAMDGYEAVRLLRAGGYDRPIVALTAHAMPADREEALRLGCDAHVSKPIDWPGLLALLESLAGAPRAVPGSCETPADVSSR